jgi:hypothetical protein
MYQHRGEERELYRELIERLQYVVVCYRVVCYRASVVVCYRASAVCSSML